VAILRGLKTRFETHHGVKYSSNALSSAAELSARYINDRHLPDKAIDVIDEAGAFARIEAFRRLGEAEKAREAAAPEGATEPTDAPLVGLAEAAAEVEIVAIGVPQIETVVARIARIPERSVGESEKEKLRMREPRLKERICGQDAAVGAIVKAVKRSRAGFRDGSKPVANFLFVGPTGVGKTELARTLASVLGIPMHRFDMSEYQEKHTVSRLIGSPPGYVGFEEGGLLTDIVRKQPHAVVLLDEIEKAHPDIFNILLQIMDYATLTDNQGRKADFRNVIFIMTSNAGARELGKAMIGFGDREVSGEAITEAVEKTFTPEFRNRLDAIVRFGHLSKEIMVSIVGKELEAVRGRLAEKKVSLEVSAEAAELIAGKGYSPEFGARNVARIIEDLITTPLVDMVLFGELSKGGTAVCTVADAAAGTVSITAKPADAT